MRGESIDGFALGIELAFVKTEDGGRTNPIGGDIYTPLGYRPNWGLPGMTPPEQTGGPVLCFGRYPVHPGDRVRAVIIPMFPDRVPTWAAVAVGDVLPMYEGARVCGRGTVRWISQAQLPVSEHDHARFCEWTRGGPEPHA